MDALKPYCYSTAMVRRSSAVEQLTVNQLVVGSIPTAGAKNPKKTSKLHTYRLGGGWLVLVWGANWGPN